MEMYSEKAKNFSMKIYSGGKTNRSEMKLSKIISFYLIYFVQNDVLVR